MSKRPKLEMWLYTLCLDDRAIAICALEAKTLKKDPEGALRSALFDTWRAGGGDLKKLVGRKILARPPTEEEGEEWDDVASATGKPYVLLTGGGEARGTA